MANQVTFKFSSEEALDVFLGWMSDGGGECGANDSYDCHGKVDGYLNFDYAKCFPAWGYDPAKHGERVVSVSVTPEDS